MNDSIAEIPLLPVKKIKEPKSSDDLKVVPVSIYKAVELLRGFLVEMDKLISSEFAGVGRILE